MIAARADNVTEGRAKGVAEGINVGGIGAKAKSGLPRDIIPQPHMGCMAAR